MRRLLRRALLTAAALTLAVVLAIAAALWWSLPGDSIADHIPGLSAAVHIGIDADGIPRIEAANPLDAAAALGFVHARDRMFEMELMRRAASGRLSEQLGSSTLRLDRFMRTLGLRRRAEADLLALDPATRAMLDAYARGVNAWIARRGRFSAPELIVLGAPEPWTPVDSLLWGKTMAIYLSGNWRSELARAAAVDRMPAARVRTLWPAQAALGLGRAASAIAAVVPRFPEPFTLPDHASNEWAVDGAHSGTGAPLLAGDPHLGYDMPSVWYLARIHTPEGVLAGATAPGIPFLVVGHNGHIAWTFTTAGADTQDVFIETPTPDGQSYATPDGPRPFIHHEERIHVRFGADQVLDVRETRHGPVLSDLDPPASGPAPVLAVAMAELAPGDTAATGLLAVNRAATVAEAGRAAAGIVAPVQNLLVADHDGIGQFTTGRVPIRASGDGTLPVDGADGKHDWTGYASGDALPHSVNPPSGRLVNANERVAGPDFPVFMGQDWFGDWRARRIRTLLDARTVHTVPSFAAMQVDAVDAFAQAVLPRLLQTTPSDDASRRALASLRGWDGWMRVDRPQPQLFNAWIRAFFASLLQREQIPPGAAGPQADVVADALGAGTTRWCGDTCDALLSSSLATAAVGFDPDAHWGDVHQAEFPHRLLGHLPLIGPLFTPHVEQPGDGNTVFAGGTFPPDWTAVHGPSFRGVYDLSNLDGSLFSLAPGQSGSLLRSGSRSLMHRWAYGSTIPLGPTAKEVETIDLSPPP